MVRQTSLRDCSIEYAYINNLVYCFLLALKGHSTSIWSHCPGYITHIASLVATLINNSPMVSLQMASGMLKLFHDGKNGRAPACKLDKFTKMLR